MACNFQVLKAQRAAKAKGYSDVLYLDSVHNKYLEEVSSCNVFVVKVLCLLSLFQNRLDIFGLLFLANTVVHHKIMLLYYFL